ncbi:MAG: hypothetical protein ACTSYT_02950, partial [Candidatus Asgardarchaeia archaeon]
MAYSPQPAAGASFPYFILEPTPAFGHPDNTRADPAQGVFRHEGIYLTAIKLPLGGGWIAEVSV